VQYPWKAVTIETMCKVAVMILQALLMQGLAADTQDVVNKMVDRLLGASSLDGANLDGTVSAKTHSDMGLPRTLGQTKSLVPGAQSSLMNRPTSSIIASLPGPTALKNKAVSMIEATNRRGCVSVQAAPSFWQESLDSPPMDKAKVQEMAGITAPMGLFDPIGMSARVPEGLLLFYREAELKHGRVCMLAVLGLLVGEAGAFIPILGEGIPAGTPAFELPQVAFAQKGAVEAFWPAVIGAIGVIEWGWAISDEQKTRAPGDYQWDPLGMKPKDAKGLKELQDKELNNGRLAMLAAAGIIAQEQVTGSNIFFR
jgi:hypothetical protein